MPMWNFAFGSHLSREQLRRIIGQEPKSALRAILPDHRLTFWKLTKFPQEYAQLAAGGGPALVPAKGHRVYGVVYEISERQLVILDEYEGKWGYARVQVRVQLEDGRSLLTHAHNLTERSEYAPPSSEFLSLMLEGLKQHGYSSHIVESVKNAAYGHPETL